MPELLAVQTADAPRTRDSLARDVRNLGLEAGLTVMVHASLSALGWVCGGSVTVIRALQDVLTEGGTLAMPACSGDLSDPAQWQNPPVPREWHQTIRDNMPAFDPRLTPTRGVGRMAETFRSFPGVLRSDHPTASLCVWGRHADFVTTGHPLVDSMGEGSPLARLYDLDARVLLLGTERNSSLHLAEHRSGMRGRVRQGAPVMRGGERVWQVYRDLDHDDTQFPEIRAAFEAAGGVRRGPVGSARAGLMSQRALVDFAAAYLRERG